MKFYDSFERDQDRPLRATYEGYTGTLAELAEHFGIKLSTLRSRISSGWSVDDAIERGMDERIKDYLTYRKKH